MYIPKELGDQIYEIILRNWPKISSQVKSKILGFLPLQPISYQDFVLNRVKWNPQETLGKYRGYVIASLMELLRYNKIKHINKVEIIETNSRRTVLIIDGRPYLLLLDGFESKRIDSFWATYTTTFI